MHVGAGTSWLCPTPFDRERLLDMEGRIGRARAIMYGSLAVAFAAASPWVGPWIMLPLAASPAVYSLVRRRIATSTQPEYLVAATVLNGQLMIGVGIALSGGPQSPALPILLLPIVTLPARFSSRGVAAGVVVTVVVLLASTVGVDPHGFADDPTYVLVGLAAIGGLAAFSHTLMRSEIEQRADAVLDPLTGLLNRKALATRFPELAGQAALTNAPLSLIAFDLDHFKSINDKHGHDEGDGVLKAVAYVVRKSLRSFELAYRVGGEEFLVVLPGSSLEEGVAVAQRIREALEAECPRGLRVTASFGVAHAIGADVQLQPLVRAADAALYAAKRAGRNVVVAARWSGRPDTGSADGYVVPASP